MQGLPSNASPLIQFGISPDQAEEMEIVRGAEGRRWCEKLVKGDLEGRPKDIAQRWPRLEIVDAEFKGDS